MPVNNLESILNQSLGMGSTTPAAGTGAAAQNAADPQNPQAQESAQPAATVTLSSRALPRTIVNSYEKVELSSRVPQQISVSTMQASERIANAVMSGGNLGRADMKAVRESRVLAALTGMRVLQAQTGENAKVWLSGVPAPTKAEMQEAYRRLTQRLSQPTETGELMRQNAQRINLLESFRAQDFRGFAAPDESASAAA